MFVLSLNCKGNHMNVRTLFKITQGMYITGATDHDGRLVGSAIDSVMVAEMDPPQVLVSLNDASYTREIVKKTKKMSLSVLPQTQTIDIIKRFGYQSSRTANKWADTPHEIIDNLPVVKGSVCYLILKVASMIETSHHTVFYCDVVEAAGLTMENPMSYGYYQEILLPQSRKAQAK